MADGSGDSRVHNLTPEDVARGVAENRMLLVDVREENEVALERYPAAVVVPLSSFDPAERVKLEQISATFTKVTLRFGFMESPNVPKALAIARKLGWQFDIMSTSFFLSRRALKPAAHSGMPRWQDHLFISLSRTANDATDYFQIPSGRVVEVGTQVTV